jgi:hypothetical protein
MVRLLYVRGCWSVSTVSGWPWGIRQKFGTSHQVLGLSASRLWTAARGGNRCFVVDVHRRVALQLHPHPAPIPFSDQQCAVIAPHFVALRTAGRPVRRPVDDAHPEDADVLAAALDALLRAKPHLANRKPRGTLARASPAARRVRSSCHSTNTGRLPNIPVMHHLSTIVDKGGVFGYRRYPQGYTGGTVWHRSRREV